MVPSLALARCRERAFALAGGVARQVHERSGGGSRGNARRFKHQNELPVGPGDMALDARILDQYGAAVRTV